MSNPQSQDLKGRKHILMKIFCVEIVPNNVFQNLKRPANRRGVGDILRVNG